MITIEAVYTSGILRPLKPLEMEEGTRLEVIIANGAPPIQATSATQTPAQILGAIAALPLEGGPNGFSGSEHDSILYGEQGAR